MRFLIFLLMLIMLSGCGGYDRDLKKIYGKVTDVEPNDAIKQANQSVISDAIVGFYDKKDKSDIDFYKIGTQAKDVSYELSLTAVPGVDARMKIYNEKGRILYTVDENSKDESEKLWEFHPVEDFFYISVESKTGYNKKVPYVLNIIKKEDAPSEEIEPNNVEKDANAIKLGQTIKGFISPKNDIDYYKIAFDDDVVHDFSIEVETLSNVDINFILFNKLSGEYKTINNFSWGGTETFSYLSSNKGSYYVKISGKISDDKKDPLYYLTVKELSGSTDEGKETYFEREDNDKPENATEIISGSEMIGTYNPAKDGDWFKFELFKKPISVDLSVSRVKGIDPIMEIYDDKNKLLKTVNGSGKDNGEQTALNDLDTGKYYVKLYAEDGSLFTYKLYFYIRYE